MSGLMEAAEGAFDNKESKEAQGGDQIERSADSGANSEINNVASDFGVPQAADGEIDKVADAKINEDIPGGNN